MQRCIPLTAAREGKRDSEGRPPSLPPSHVHRHEICSGGYSPSAGRGDVRRHRVFTVHDHGERLAVVGLLEGGLTAHQHEQDHPQTPDICRHGRGLQLVPGGDAQTRLLSDLDPTTADSWSGNHVQSDTFRVCVCTRTRIPSESGLTCSSLKASNKRSFDVNLDPVIKRAAVCWLAGWSTDTHPTGT